MLPELAGLPFERRATLMLASGANAARSAAEQASLADNADPFLSGAAAGISANLCDALAGFINGDETTGLDLEFAWASSRPAPIGTATQLNLGCDHAAILREGARMLRATGATPDFELDGAVVGLESANAGVGGVAVIAGPVDGEPRKVRVSMGAPDYALATLAHKEGQLLRCEGELARQGRQYMLERVRHVAVAADDD